MDSFSVNVVSLRDSVTRSSVCSVSCLTIVLAAAILSSPIRRSIEISACLTQSMLKAASVPAFRLSNMNSCSDLAGACCINSNISTVGFTRRRPTIISKAWCGVIIFPSLYSIAARTVLTIISAAAPKASLCFTTSSSARATSDFFFAGSAVFNSSRMSSSSRLSCLGMFFSTNN